MNILIDEVEFLGGELTDLAPKFKVFVFNLKGARCVDAELQHFVDWSKTFKISGGSRTYFLLDEKYQMGRRKMSNGPKKNVKWAKEKYQMSKILRQQMK